MILIECMESSKIKWHLLTISVKYRDTGDGKFHKSYFRGSNGNVPGSSKYKLNLKCSNKFLEIDNFKALYIT